MRYFLIILLLFLFPLHYLNAQNDSDIPTGYPSKSQGTVTTRTGGTVTTRSSNVATKKQSGKAKPEPVTKKSKSKKTKVSKPQSNSDVEADTTTLKGMLSEEAVGYRNEARKLQTAGDLTGALSYYKKCLQLNPYNIDTLNDLGVIYEGLGDTVSAVEVYSKALEMNPNYIPVYANLALLYEARGDEQNAIYYWKKRYEMGKEGDYWRQIAKQHLLQLGAYPDVQEEMVDKEVARFSRDVADKLSQRNEENYEDARLHYSVGAQLFSKKDYKGALKEFETSLSLNPAEDTFKVKIMDFYKRAEKAYAREAALADAEDAVRYIKNDNYSSAAEKLKGALSTVYRVTQEK